MRGYELCLILNSDISEDALESILKNLGDIIGKHKGSVLKTDKWGKKNFKFPIKKHSKGFYCFLFFMGNNDILREIDRSVRFNETILRYNIMRLENNFNVEEKAEVPSPDALAIPTIAEVETVKSAAVENSEIS